MSFDDFGRHKNLQSFHIKVDHWSGITNFYHLQGHLLFLATLSAVMVEIKYGNDNEENRNGVPVVLTVVKLPHAAKQTNCLPFFNLISGPPAWKEVDKNMRMLLASSLVINLFQKGSMFLDEVSRWRNEFMIISEFSDIALSSQCRLCLLSHKIKQNSVVFGWQYSARLATAQPSPAQPSPAQPSPPSPSGPMSLQT